MIRLSDTFDASVREKRGESQREINGKSETFSEKVREPDGEVSRQIKKDGSEGGFFAPMRWAVGSVADDVRLRFAAVSPFGRQIGG